MKRHLGILLRLLLAAAGVAYIVWALVWTDHLLLPAGMELPDGRTLTAARSVPLLDGEPGVPGDRLVVALPAAWEAGETLTLDAGAVGTGAGDVQYQPGVVTTLAGARWSLLGVGVLLVGALPVLQAFRWLVLLRSQGLDPGPMKTFKLTLVGLFFNFCMPGMTGGDLVKAYYAAKGSGHRGAAVMSVVFDRVTGLVSIVLLAGLVGLLMLGEPAVRSLTVGVWAGLALLAIGAGTYFSARVRRRVGVDWLQRKLGPDNLLTRIDQAAFAYRRQPVAVLTAVGLSLPAHLAQMTATALAGWALGIDLSLGVLLTVLPVVFFIGALPITYQGLGVMEGVAIALLAGVALPGASGVTVNQVVGMLLLGRVYLLVYGLLGALVVLRGDIHMFPQAVAADAADTDPAERAGTLPA
ncbi:MAG: lysylphosphatidylglycerol synthase transmembrane domain-containing protein [Phycisphaeraceae bacterium]